MHLDKSYISNKVSVLLRSCIVSMYTILTMLQWQDIAPIIHTIFEACQGDSYRTDATLN